MTLEYILSQIFVVLNYLLVGSTYLLKNRKLILGLSLTAIIANAISYFFLSAWSGLAMCGVALFRNIILLVQDHFDKETKNKIVNWSIFGFLVIVSAMCGYFTYNGVLSLFSVFATFTYTISIWQKNTLVYRILGILCSCFWIVYNVFVWSLFGFICEGILLAVEVVGLIVALVKLKQNSKPEEVAETNLEEK